jgi:translation elongation factor EF-1alpha
MKIKTAVLFLFVAIQGAGCDFGSNGSDGFEMRVDNVEELKGVILKGIALSGRIKHGCIAKDDEFNIKRDGDVVLTETARILNVSNESGTAPDPKPGESIKKAVQGDTVSLYIPDRSKDDVQPGDVIVSATTSCK